MSNIILSQQNKIVSYQKFNNENPNPKKMIFIKIIRQQLEMTYPFINLIQYNFKPTSPYKGNILHEPSSNINNLQILKYQNYVKYVNSIQKLINLMITQVNAKIYNQNEYKMKTTIILKLFTYRKFLRYESNVKTQDTFSNLISANQLISQEQGFSRPKPQEDDIYLICNKQFELFNQTNMFECQHKFHLTCIQNLICPICTQEQQ